MVFSFERLSAAEAVQALHHLQAIAPGKQFGRAMSHHTLQQFLEIEGC
jgi:hypothetical protein